MRSFYTIIFQCQNVDPGLITISITWDCFNPLEMHHEIWRVYVKSGWDWFNEDNLRTVLKPVSLLSSLAASEHHNQLSRIITKLNVNSSFTGSVEWAYFRETDTNTRPSIGWWLTKYNKDAEKNLFPMSILAFLTQSHIRNW